MKPLYECLNDQLEQAKLRPRHSEQHSHDGVSPTSGIESDSSLSELVALAQRLQEAPQLEVSPDFAKQLQRRLLRHHTELKLIPHKKKLLRFSLLQRHPAFSAVLGVFLLFCIVSTSVLAMAAQVSNPSNPLYALTRLEQHVQIWFAGSPSNQAMLDLQFARTRLNTLTTLTDATQATAYRQALTDLDQQITTATSAINGLPTGSQRTQLTGDLTSLKSDAIQDLRSLLSKLALSEQFATTEELAHLGNIVPFLTSATLTLPAHPNGSATVTLAGSDLQPGAQLLVDGKVDGTLTSSIGTQENGQMVFVVPWHGDQHPHLLGILNPDDTATQMPATIIKLTSSNKNGDGGTGTGNHNENGTGNGNSNGNSHGSGNNNENGRGSNNANSGDKLPTLPTPHH